MNSQITRSFATITLAALVAGAGAGCDKYESPSDNTRPSSPPPEPPRATTPPAADNTAKNKADAEAASKTPMDQGQNAADIRITAEIRRAIMEDKSMSMNAQNCKIITERGAVTLRGPVDTQAEKDLIGTRAKAVAGVVSVDNQLEVKAR